MNTNFSFIYPLTKKNTGFTRLGDQIYNHVADLLVKGVAYITNASILNNSIKEADAVYKYLKEINIPDSDIIVENKSRNTSENAKYCFEILDSIVGGNQSQIEISNRIFNKELKDFAYIIKTNTNTG